MRRRASSFLFTALLSGIPLSRSAHGQTAPVLSVDANADRHAINPDIYGIVSYGLDVNLAKELRIPNVRWGGDGTSRYNWQVDASNAGFDWYFTGGSDTKDTVPSGSADLMIRTYKAAGARSLITIPILPYVSKFSAWNCSFPVSVYGPQQSVNPYVHPEGDSCGNSLTPSGDQLQDSAILANHVENSTTLQMSWVQHLVSSFGTAAQGAVGLYQLDNEPYGWSNTHRDVQPKAATYATIAALGGAYASAIKAVDPSAMVMGPSDFTLGGWVGSPESQDGLLAGQYYLRFMANAEALHHQRLLDYFDEHYYFQFSNPTEQLASTRTLWDSTYNGGTWVEQYVFQAPMQLIPRFKNWIGQYYPGTRLAFSEYSIDSGNGLITDALAQADVLGIFGREGVDLANMWNSPTSSNPVAYAFRLYRNFDGAGSSFGDLSVQANSSDPSRLAIYAAERTSDGALTLLVLNKTASSLASSIALSKVSATSASVWQYTAADLAHILPLAGLPVSSQSVTAVFPAYSATFLLLAHSSFTVPPLHFRPCLRSRPVKRSCAAFLTKGNPAFPSEVGRRGTSLRAE